MSASNDQHTEITFRMKLTQPDSSTLSEVGLYLYDFDSLYELIRLAIDEKYQNFAFSRFALYRGHRKLESIDRLHVQSLTLESPLEVVSSITAYTGAVAAILGTVWLLVQIIEKIYNIRLNHEKLQLEVEKLRRALPEEETIGKNADQLDILQEREALEYIEIVERRLAHSEYEVVELDFSVDVPAL